MTLAALQTAVLYLAPCLALLVFLCAGRYPGEQALERVRRHLHAPVRRAPAALGRPRPRPRRAGGSGGRLLARRLAGRGPPAVG